MMNTQWDDDGETLFENNWYGVVLGAAASWQAAPLDLAAFERDFDWAFFRHEGDALTKATRTLGAVNTKLGINNSDQLFWRDPFTDNFQEAVARKLAQQAIDVLGSAVGQTGPHRGAAERRTGRQNAGPLGPAFDL